MSGRLNLHAGWALALTLLLWSGIPTDSTVADAAMAGDHARVEALLRAGEDVNAAQGDGMTALHWAAERSDAALANMLLAAGAEVGATTRIGAYTPLHLAARNGAAGVVRAVIGAGGEPDARTTTGGAAPLHFAAANGSVETILALVEGGANVDIAEGAWEQTPLMFAAAAGRTAAVVALLDAGAGVEIQARVMDLSEREAIDQADRRIQGQRSEAIVAAREGRSPRSEESRGGYGQSPQPQGIPQRPAAQEPPATTGLTRDEINQAQRDRRPTGRLSHAELVGGYGGLSALHLATREGHFETATILLDRGASIDRKSGGDGTPPLVMAAINGHFDLAMELLERGADATVASDAGATALYATINTQWIPKSRHPQPADYMQQQVGYLELMRALLDGGVDVNRRLDRQLWFTTFGDDYLRTNRAGATAFWRAAYALDVDAMELLVEYGADPHIPTVYVGSRFGSRGGDGPDPSGLPPAQVGDPGAFAIHAASGIGYGEGFAANIHRTVPNGWLPAVRYLVEELGADVNARDHNGYNAIHHAAARGDDELIRYLVSKGGDPLAVARSGQTTVDMANGPVQRITPFPTTIALLESLGAVNNDNCVPCQ